MLALSVIVALFGSTEAFLWGSTEWTQLMTTWNPIPGGTALGKAPFDVPLTVTEAKKKKWTQFMSCSDGVPGNVYIGSDGDQSSMPIYNADGYISGLILGVGSQATTGLGSSWTNDPSMFAMTKFTPSGGDMFYGVMAVFRDPTKTCTAGTTDTSVAVGDRLWFANGAGAGKYLEIPLTAYAGSDDRTALEAAGFQQGACFFGMGVHFWKDMKVTMNCDDANPLFMLYAQEDRKPGKLVGWGIALAHSDRPDMTSKRWEHPGGGPLKLFFKDGTMPNCLPNMGTLSTQHIFFTNPSGKSGYCSIFA